MNNSDVFYSMDNISKGLKDTPNAAYAQCSALVGYIVEKHGEEALFQLVSQLTYDRKPLKEALMDTLHIDVAEFEKNSQQYFLDNKESRGVFKALP